MNKTVQIFQDQNWSEFVTSDGLLEVIVGEVFSPDDFLIRLKGESTSASLESLMDRMEEFYDARGDRFKIDFESLAVGMVCASIGTDGNWYRALISSIDIASVQVFHVDYGGTSSVRLDTLCYLMQPFSLLPRQSIKAKLHGVKSPGEGWPLESSRRFLELVTVPSKMGGLLAYVNGSELSLWLVDTISNDLETGIDINKVLVEEGFAMSDELPVDSESMLPDREWSLSHDEKEVTRQTNQNVKQAKESRVEKRIIVLKDKQIDTVKIEKCWVEGRLIDRESQVNEKLIASPNPIQCLVNQMRKQLGMKTDMELQQVSDGQFLMIDNHEILIKTDPDDKKEDHIKNNNNITKDVVGAHTVTSRSMLRGRRSVSPASFQLRRPFPLTSPELSSKTSVTSSTESKSFLPTSSSSTFEFETTLQNVTTPKYGYNSMSDLLNKEAKRVDDTSKEEVEDVKHCIRLRGLPWSATKDEIGGVFCDCNIKGGTDGIHIIKNKEGRPSGDAFIIMDTKEDVKEALKKDRTKMGNRYLEVFLAKSGEMERRCK